MSGLVSIVGAGPGDPELLTVAAVRRLERADVVLHDALVSPGVLALASHALRVPVGKRAGRPSARQESIHRLLIRFARRGRRVVRLKGGDPFVLGRGGEEALALEAAGVAYEVIPGLSSALSAPALAGIPVTHRGLASAFVVVSGHAESAFRPIVSSLVPGAATLVVLMGLGTRATLVPLLLSRGWKASTPAAICYGASTSDAFTWTGRLDELPHASAPGTDAPGTLVIGDVVSLAARIGPRRAEHEEPEKERIHARR